MGNMNFNNRKDLIKKSKDNLIKSIIADIDIIYWDADNDHVIVEGYNQFIDSIKDKLDLLKIKVIENQNEPVIYADTDSFHIPFID